MLANIDAMRDMLTETLSFAEGDASADASAPFDLASILISLCDEASDAGAQAEYDGPNHVTAFGKRTAIRRMVSNLIDNAVRYGGAARVSLSEDATDWIVTVADDGPGIPPGIVRSGLRAVSEARSLAQSRDRRHGPWSIDHPRHCARAWRADFARQRVPRFGRTCRQRSLAKSPRRRELGLVPSSRCCRFASGVGRRKASASVPSDGSRNWLPPVRDASLITGEQITLARAFYWVHVYNLGKRFGSRR